MPEKLMSCVRQVMAEGKSESSAFAICVSSLGISPHSSDKEEEKEARPRKLRKKKS